MRPASIFPWWPLAAALALLLTPPLGCSSSSGNAGCVSSQCASGNECIDDGSGKGAACHKICAAASECPFNYYCNDGQPKSWCVPSTLPIPPQPTGQWGSPCQPSGGEGNNPSCDGTDGFACYGTTPTDANAFCSVFGCAADSDCPGAWWCGTVNRAPNVTTDQPSFGPTRRICLPRSYCAPCQLDHDCPASSDGTQQHCARDAQGAGYCAPECATDANCPLDATCKTWQSLCTPAAGAICASDEGCPPVNGVVQHCDDGRCTPECASEGECAADGAGTDAAPGDASSRDSAAADSGAADAGKGAPRCQLRGLCTPRAGVCVGAGGFCSPCRSDVDCANGFCLSGAPYSTERFCSVKSARVPCNTTAANPPGCPAPQMTDNWLADECLTTPANQCEALVGFGGSGIPGCWTVNR